MHEAAGHELGPHMPFVQGAHLLPGTNGLSLVNMAPHDDWRAGPMQGKDAASTVEASGAASARNTMMMRIVTLRARNASDAG